MKPYEIQYCFLAILSDSGVNFPTHGNISVCPECRLDDFSHFEGCEIGNLLDELYCTMNDQSKVINQLNALLILLEKTEVSPQ